VVGERLDVSIIRHRKSLTLNSTLTGISIWMTHESKEINCRKDDLGWIKIPLDKITTKRMRLAMLNIDIIL
jgi:hypothetical protein